MWFLTALKMQKYSCYSIYVTIEGTVIHVLNVCIYVCMYIYQFQPPPVSFSRLNKMKTQIETTHASHKKS